MNSRWDGYCTGMHWTVNNKKKINKSTSLAMIMLISVLCVLQSQNIFMLRQTRMRLEMTVMTFYEDKKDMMLFNKKKKYIFLIVHYYHKLSHFHNTLLFKHSPQLNWIESNTTHNRHLHIQTHTHDALHPSLCMEK